MSIGERKTERVVSYIDGFNLYFGLREAGLECYKWLNVNALSSSILHQHQPLIGTKYFTSRVTSPQAKVIRQSAYLDALGTIPDLTVHYGKYARDKEVECSSCRQKTLHAQEKMTDVNIAVSLLEDAYQDVFDTALLISGDSDLCPPIKAIRRIFPHKRVIVAFPPARVSSELKQVSSATLHIGHANIKRCQLPDIIAVANRPNISRPSHVSYQIPVVMAPATTPKKLISLPADPPNPTPKLPPGYRR
jgi:hypothetical protein